MCGAQSGKEREGEIWEDDNRAKEVSAELNVRATSTRRSRWRMHAAYSPRKTAIGNGMVRWHSQPTRKLQPQSIASYREYLEYSSKSLVDWVCTSLPTRRPPFEASCGALGEQKVVQQR